MSSKYLILLGKLSHTSKHCTIFYIKMMYPPGLYEGAPLKAPFTMVKPGWFSNTPKTMIFGLNCAMKHA